MTEAFIEKAQSLDADALKQAALHLSGEVVTMAGPYAIEENGKQTGMQNVVMQNMPETGLEVVFPEPVKTADFVYPIPAWNEALKL